MSETSRYSPILLKLWIRSPHKDLAFALPSHHIVQHRLLLYWRFFWLLSDINLACHALFVALADHYLLEPVCDVVAACELQYSL